MPTYRADSCSEGVLTWHHLCNGRRVVYIHAVHRRDERQLNFLVPGSGQVTTQRKVSVDGGQQSNIHYNT
jgi:hypothetical protein